MTRTIVPPKIFGTGYSRYRVELELYEESGEPRSDCFVHHDPHGTTRGTGCTASLAALDGTGYLENFTSGSMHKVEPGMIEDIMAWAIENGY